MVDAADRRVGIIVGAANDVHRPKKVECAERSVPVEPQVFPRALFQSIKHGPFEALACPAGASNWHPRSAARGRNSPAELPFGFKTFSRSLRPSVNILCVSCVLIFTTFYKVERFQVCPSEHHTVGAVASFSAGFRRLVSGQPSGGRELGDSIDREVCQAWQDRAKIVTNRDF
jgi:hypothetical protein